ncbi:hypothetical protein MtrunA17_Chr3g0124451 [Medicago truncatula]|uniref:Uncharacterized protein n=1 Tax=Medicago truncatula TaxID=3880 RepID=A0A396IXK3_MEDTR|nr:hypothetical protein MtrunA17_Chr3g0124451 [Medicago truncatula]
MRSLGVSSVADELDLDKLRFRVICPSLGVVADLGVVLCRSAPLTASVFHLRCLFAGSLFPTNVCSDIFASQSRKQY